MPDERKIYPYTPTEAKLAESILKEHMNLAPERES